MTRLPGWFVLAPLVGALAAVVWWAIRRHAMGEGGAGLPGSTVVGCVVAMGVLLWVSALLPARLRLDRKSGRGRLRYGGRILGFNRNFALEEIRSIVLVRFAGQGAPRAVGVQLGDQVRLRDVLILANHTLSPAQRLAEDLARWLDVKLLEAVYGSEGLSPERSVDVECSSAGGRAAKVAQVGTVRVTDDPVGGRFANFRTTRVVIGRSGESLSVVPSIWHILFCSVFVSVCTPVLVLTLVSMTWSWWGLAFGALGIVGIFAFVSEFRLRCDKRTNTLRYRPSLLKGWKGRRLSDVIAVQTLYAGYMDFGKQNDQAPFPRYEMNLVFADGKRYCVSTHSRIASMRRDAERIAAFLGVRYLAMETEIDERGPREIFPAEPGADAESAPAATAGGVRVARTPMSSFSVHPRPIRLLRRDGDARWVLANRPGYCFSLLIPLLLGLIALSAAYRMWPLPASGQRDAFGWIALLVVVPMSILFGLAGLAATAAGVWLLLRINRWEFDRAAGELRHRHWLLGRRRTWPLAEVVAVQVLRGGRRPGDRHMREMNLVLADGTRLHVTRHRDRSWFNDVAPRLAEFLGAELLDDDAGADEPENARRRG